MILRHTVIYIGSRIFAAALNLLSVALFARLAGPETFGQYLLYLASAYIVYGFAIQWLRMSFFAVYKANHSLPIVGTFIWTMAFFVGLVVLIAGVVALVGFYPRDVIVGTVLPTIGIAVFETFFEISRARLKVELIGVATLFRALFVPVGGAAGFEMTGTAVGLAAGVSLAHILAATPLVREAWSAFFVKYSGTIAREYLKYGSPLILAFGINAVGQSADRLLLARLDSVGAVGPYGAVGDLIKQSLVVVSEAVAGSYMPHAKRAASDGDSVQTRTILTEAFRAYAFITLFGAAFIFCFAPDVVRLLFGEPFEQAAETLVPFFTIATALYVFRAYYFGQAIYFLGNASAELYASTATAVAGIVTAALLIPSHGSTGAAIGLLAAQTVGCFVAALAARKWQAMPFPLLDLLGIATVAAAAAFIADAAALLPIGHVALLVLRFTVLSAGACFIVAAYDIFGLGVWARKLAFRKVSGCEAID